MDETRKIEEILEDEAAKMEAEVAPEPEKDADATIMMPAPIFSADEKPAEKPVEKPASSINAAVINPKADLAALDALEHELFALRYAMGELTSFA